MVFPIAVDLIKDRKLPPPTIKSRIGMRIFFVYSELLRSESPDWTNPDDALKLNSNSLLISEDLKKPC